VGPFPHFHEDKGHEISVNISLIRSPSSTTYFPRHTRKNPILPLYPPLEGNRGRIFSRLFVGNYFFLPFITSSAQLNAATTVGKPIVLVRRMIA